MIETCTKLILGLMFTVLVPGTAQACSKAEEDSLFEKKDETFWVLKNKDAFHRGAVSLVGEDGSWKGEPPIPKYIKFTQPLTKEDLPCLERWLSLKDLQCFAVADQNEQPNLRLIMRWLSDLKDLGQDSDEDLERRNLFKLAWLNLKSTFREVDREVNYGHSNLPAAWVETNRAFQMWNSHYPPENGLQAPISPSVETR